MQKRRIYWPYGNPQYDAWEILSPADQPMVRRNHDFIRSGDRRSGLSMFGSIKNILALSALALSRNFPKLQDISSNRSLALLVADGSKNSRLENVLSLVRIGATVVWALEDRLWVMPDV